MYTVVYLPPLEWVLLRLKKVSHAFHYFPILSACSPGEILIKIKYH